MYITHDQLESSQAYQDNQRHSFIPDRENKCKYCLENEATDNDMLCDECRNNENIRRYEDE